ncbi:MAG: serine hydrolase [Ignavibacteria bacterium]|nr:serine hydrolase [Ignavibacteria bacterium]
MKLRNILLLILLFSISYIAPLSAQSMYFPPAQGNSWDTLSPTSLNWNVKLFDSLFSFLKTNNSKAFIVLQNGKIVVEKYFDSFTRDSVWYWASAGKTLTAFAIGLAKQEGLLTLSDTSSHYLGNGWTSLPLAKEQAITIRHQLTMTTGLNDNVPDPDCTLPDCLTYKADAGTRWAYHTAPYTLLDSVIFRASGQSPSVFLYQRLHAKTGFNGLFIRSGYNNVFYSTPRNMARFGLLLLNHGTWDNQQILSDTSYFSAMTHPSQNLNLSYGYLTWLNGQSSFMIPQTQFVFPGPLCPSAPPDMYAALGKNGQFINVVPSKNMVWIRMGNAPDNSLVPFLLNEQIWQILAPIIAGTGSSVTGETNPRDNNVLNELIAYPNPANPGTWLTFSTSGNNNSVTLIIYDILGRKITELFNGELAPGSHRLYWNGMTCNGQPAPTGMYIARIYGKNLDGAAKIILVR